VDDGCLLGVPGRELPAIPVAFRGLDGLVAKDQGLIEPVFALQLLDRLHELQIVDPIHYAAPERLRPGNRHPAARPDHLGLLSLERGSVDQRKAATQEPQ
jgi:hypothetical protein